MSRPAQDPRIAAGMAACDAGRTDEAARLFASILSAEPGSPAAANGLARALLMGERFAQAWPAFEARFALMEAPPGVSARPGGRPVRRWTEGPPPRRLLILDEQGMGDTIQFVRFLPRLVARGCDIVLVTHRRLFALIHSLGLPIALRPMDEPGSVAQIEAWCPLLSLPAILGLTAEELGMPAPYLRADPERVAAWGGRLRPPPLRVGIAWQGNPAAPVDEGRSAPLAAMAPLACVPGLALYSLQRGAGSEQLRTAAFGGRVLRFDEMFDAGSSAFADTAAVMTHLDLVITVDTAIAHLAGALGRPVWIGLRRAGVDWRWSHSRDDSLWYPTARLFRQRRPGDWFEVFGRMAEAARGLVRAEGDVRPSVPISVGELFDRLGILALKRRHIDDAARRATIERQAEALGAARAALGLDEMALAPIVEELDAVNARLWRVEEEIRACEARGEFGPDFVALARSVYRENDRRAALKSRIDAATGSALREEKCYGAVAPGLAEAGSRHRS